MGRAAKSLNFMDDLVDQEGGKTTLPSFQTSTEHDEAPLAGSVSTAVENENKAAVRNTGCPIYQP